jgi:competence protein ComEC
MHPLVHLALIYAAGVLLADYFPASLPAGLAGCLVLGVVGSAWRSDRPWLRWFLIFLVGYTNLCWRTAILSPSDLRAMRGIEPEIVTLRGVLADTPDARMYARDQREIARFLAPLDVARIRRSGAEWETTHGRVLVLTPGLLPSGFYAGQKVEVTGVISPPPGALAEGLFDYGTYLRRQGIYFQLKAESTNDWVVLSPGQPQPWSARFLTWAQATLARGLPEEDESLHLLWAMTLGWKTGLTQEIYEPFMLSGTMHIFAISGLHIALISGILVSLLRVVRISRAWCGIVVVPSLWLYTGATGWQPSAIRSAIMMTVIIGGWSLRRPSNLLNSLAGAALIILVWEPRQLFGASFQLSFFCVLSLALVLPPVQRGCDRLLAPDAMLPADLVPAWRRRLHGPLRGLLMAGATSFAAWLGSLPLTAYYFHLFSPLTLIANLLIVPLSSLALACNIGSLLCGDWLSGLGELFNHSAWFWMACMVRLSGWAASARAAYFYVQSPSIVAMGVYYLVLVGSIAGGLFTHARRWWSLALVLILALYGLAQWGASRHSVTLHILPFDGGLGVFVRSPGWFPDLLVDPGSTNAVELVTRPFLQAQGVNRLPTLLLTHGDVRHIGGALLLVDRFCLPQTGISTVRFRSPIYRRVLARLAEFPKTIQRLSRDDRVGPWTVIHPGPEEPFPQADDNAMVLRGTLNGTRILLLSDLGPKGQNALLDRGVELASDIVVTGLPTRGEALSDSFLEAVRPRLIIVADSDSSRPGVANARLGSRLSERQVPVVYTHASGAVTLTIKTSGWELRSANGYQLSRE